MLLSSIVQSYLTFAVSSSSERSTKSIDIQYLHTMRFPKKEVAIRLQTSETNPIKR